MTESVDNPKSVRDVARPANTIVTLLQEVYRIAQHWHTRWPVGPVRWFFRGADKAVYSCDPGLLREPHLGGDLLEVEWQKANDFRVRGRPFLAAGPIAPWDLMFLMQHHGVATRLLDWTESLACATYFASRDISDGDDGAIWMLATRFLVERGLGGPGANLSAADPRLGPYKLREVRESNEELERFNRAPPLPIIPDHVSPRIIAQTGRFTIHTFTPRALEELAEVDRAENGEACFLHQIVVPGSAKGLLRQQARIVGGATEDSLFPDLDGLARGMRWEDEERAQDSN